MRLTPPTQSNCSDQNERHSSSLSRSLRGSSTSTAAGLADLLFDYPGGADLLCPSSTHTHLSVLVYRQLYKLVSYGALEGERGGGACVLEHPHRHATPS